jgi:hypothetical protein
MKKLIKAVAQFYSSHSEAQIIEQIHDAFDNASKSALAEANKILEEAAKNGDAEERKRLMKLIGIDPSMAMATTKVTAEEMTKILTRKRIIDEYTQKYPHLKIIFPEQVQAICNKYKLIHAPISWYKGVIPMKNLKEVADFSLCADDILYMSRSYYGPTVSFMEAYNRYPSITTLPRISNTCIEGGDIIKVVEQSEEIYGNLRTRFEICAPKEDIIVPEGSRLSKGKFSIFSVPDPIILFPQKNCYIIVSKWGLEASDPLVVNEKMN